MSTWTIKIQGKWQANAATTRKPAFGIIYTSKLFHFPWCRRGNKFNEAAISGAGVLAADLETETDSREVAPTEKMKHTASAQAVSQVRGLPSLGGHLLTVSTEINSGKYQKATDRSIATPRQASLSRPWNRLLGVMGCHSAEVESLQPALIRRLRLTEWNSARLDPALNGLACPLCPLP